MRHDVVCLLAFVALACSPENDQRKSVPQDGVLANRTAPSDDRGPVTNPFQQSVLDRQYVPFGLVAHALGEVDGHPYTNSREAFLRSYDRGFRVFEVDLVMLGDGTVWTVHNRFEKRYGLDDRFDRLTSVDLEGAVLDGKYHPMPVGELLKLVAEWDDVWVILDTKAAPRSIPRAERLEIHVDTLAAVVAAADGEREVLDRLVPHIGTEDDHDRIDALYPFPHYMFAIYRSDVFEEPNWSDERIVEFVRERDIGAVMMWWDRRYSDRFARQLRDVGAAVFVHSLNDQKRIDAFRSKGVGVYSDGFFYDP